VEGDTQKGKVRVGATLPFSIPLMEPVVTAIRDAIFEIRPKNFEELLVLANRIKACCSEQNRFQLEGSEKSGRLWQCGSPLCPSCQALHSRRNFFKLREKIFETKLFSGESFRFVTLTIPTSEHSLLLRQNIYREAFRIFRRSIFFKETFRAWKKSEEFTLSKGLWHYHIHLLGVSRFVAHYTIRQKWSEAVEKSLKKFNLKYDVRTVDKLCVVNILRVGSIQNACREMSKYVTKPTAFAKINSLQMIELASLPRWKRMHEYGGVWRSCVSPSAEEDSEIFDCNSDPKTYLDKKSVKGKSGSVRCDQNEVWRKHVDRYGAETYASFLQNEIFFQQRRTVKYLQSKFPQFSVNYSNDLPAVERDLKRDLKFLTTRLKV
jgi:replication protein